MGRKEEGWAHCRINPMLFYLILKSHREIRRSNSGFCETVCQVMVGKLQDSVGAPGWRHQEEREQTVFAALWEKEVREKLA